MAKYVYCLPGELPYAPRPLKGNWTDLLLEFGNDLADRLLAKYGLATQPFLDSDGIEVSKGSSAMGKDWFSFHIRVFSELAVYLVMLNVPVEFRRHGIGAFIADELKRFASVNSIKYIYLDSYEPANPFWEACGFIKVRHHPEYILGYNLFQKKQVTPGDDIARGVTFRSAGHTLKDHLITEDDLGSYGLIGTRVDEIPCRTNLSGC